MATQSWVITLLQNEKTIGDVYYSYKMGRQQTMNGYTFSYRYPSILTGIPKTYTGKRLLMFEQIGMTLSGSASRIQQMIASQKAPYFNPMTQQNQMIDVDATDREMIMLYANQDPISNVLFAGMRARQLNAQGNTFSIVAAELIDFNTGEVLPNFTYGKNALLSWNTTYFAP